MAIRVGCGSWTDEDYVGVLYPPSAPARTRLELYARWFDRLELNGTYYRTPAAKVTAGWAKQTPAGFKFDYKLHRRFSQSPRRAAEGDELKRVLAASEPLRAARKFGVFLLTLPPTFGPERHELADLEGVAKGLAPHLVAVELRDRAWVTGAAKGETFAFFRKHGLVWVALDLPKLNAPPLLPAIDEVTNPRVAYFRLHGRNPRYLTGKSAAEKHRYDYPLRELKQIMGRVHRLAAAATDVHVSVNNHAANYAPKAALALRRLLGQKVTGVALGGGE